MSAPTLRNKRDSFPKERWQLNRHVYLFLIVGFALASCERPNVATNPKSATPEAGSTQPAATTQPAAPSYQASLNEGISFAKPGYPEFVARAEGISQTEPFGRWTDGPKATIVFKEPLPKKFELVVKGAAYGPNIDQPVRITVVGVMQEIVFNSNLSKDPQTRRFSFSLEQLADRIEFEIPQPTQPANGDVRKLGIALVELKIEPAAK
jgi:phosphoglycerol transferase